MNRFDSEAALCVAVALFGGATILLAIYGLGHLDRSYP